MKLRLLITGVAVVTMGCGVPVDHSPRPIPDDRVPFDLLDPRPVPTTTPSPPASSAPATGG